MKTVSRQVDAGKLRGISITTSVLRTVNMAVLTSVVSDVVQRCTKITLLTK